jgi:hypothetical protein
MNPKLRAATADRHGQEVNQSETRLGTKTWWRHHDAQPDVEDQMSDTSRRKFLAAAGIGAAGTVGLTGEKAQAAPEPAGATRNSTSAREAVVAYVEHPFSDRVHLMVGEREIVVQDEDLAARILNAAGGR